MFGSNLRELAAGFPSISELARQLGINRTQFNRYLAGESFPRPDVLARICDFFEVDARVLLEPVGQLRPDESGLTGPELAAFLGKSATPAATLFPGGFYSFSRKSFVDSDRFVLGLVHVWRNRAGRCFVRGFEAREAMNQQGLRVSAQMREFCGPVLAVENGIAMLISRRNGLTVSFNFLHPVASFENNFWIGYVTRTVPETIEAHRATRMVYEHLGHDLPRALATARMAGLVSANRVPAYHLRLLQPGTGFR